MAPPVKPDPNDGDDNAGTRTDLTSTGNGDSFISKTLSHWSPSSTPPTSTLSEPPSTTDIGAGGQSQSTPTMPPTTSEPRQESMSTLSHVFSTTVTGKNGKPSVEIPPYFTSIYQLTNSDGSIITVTDVAVNPTGILAPGSHKDVSPFFQNRGAVAGVFLIAGVALMSMILVLFFAWRRRKRERLRKARILHIQRRAAEQTNGSGRRPFEDDEAAAGEQHHSTTTPSASDAELQIEMSQRPMSPNNFNQVSTLYGANPRASRSSEYRHSSSEYHSQQQHHTYPSQPVTPYDQPPLHSHLSVYPGQASHHYANGHGDGYPFPAAESTTTLDHVLDPTVQRTFRRGEGGNKSFHSEHSTLHDDVDYTRKVWQPQPSGLRTTNM